MEQAIHKWIREHDRVATHAKIWPYNNEHHFQCCIGQEVYGGVFTMNTKTHTVRCVN